MKRTWPFALVVVLIAALSSCGDARRSSRVSPSADVLQTWPAIASTFAASARALSRSPLKASLPATADGALVLGLPGTTSTLRVTRRGATAITGASDGHVMVYAGAGPIDVLMSATSTGIEELLVVHERQATITYDVELPSSFTLRDEAERTVAVVDAAGRTQLRVSAPHAWDGAGATMPLTLHARGSTLLLGAPSDAKLPWLVDPIWSTPKALIAARARHTSTLLPSGKIWVAGGLDGPTLLASTELYDPATGTSSPGPKLGIPRVYHTAVLLRNGLVLIAGGSVDGPQMSTEKTKEAELYDPVSSSVTVLPVMHFARAHHTATLLLDGRVLIAGGTFHADAAEIFDPATKTFLSAATPVGVRGRHTATRLPSGEVLLVGGHSAEPLDMPGILVDVAAEIFDVATGAFRIAPNLPVRAEHTTTGLPNGDVIVAGGTLGTADVYRASTGALVSSTPMENRSHHAAVLLQSELVIFVGGAAAQAVITQYDAAAPATLEKTVALVENRQDATATLVPGGDVVIIGGTFLSTDTSVAQRALASVETYADELGGLVSDVVSLNAAARDPLVTPLANGNVFVSGGTDAPSNRIDVYDAKAEAFTLHTTMTATRTSHTATPLDPSGALIAGGGTASAEVFDGVTSKSTGSMLHSREQHSAVRLASGKVLVVGGDGTTVAELYDPATGKFQATAGVMNAVRTAATATLLPDGEVLVTGGLGLNGSPVASAETYAPVSQKFTATGSMQAARRLHTATLLPSGKVLVAAGSADSSAELYDPATRSFTLTSTPMTQERVGTAATLLPSGKVLFLGGVSGADDTTPDELYDPRNDVFAPVPASAYVGTFPGAALLVTGGVLACGGTHLPLGRDVLSTCSLWRASKPLLLSDRRPTIDAVPVRVAGGAPVPITGALFSGSLEASGGGATTSPGDNPIAIWMPLGGGLVAGGVTVWTASTAVWTAPATSLSGPGRLFVATDGELSNAVMVAVTPGENGALCSHDSDCGSKNCADGVCCDTACRDVCMACSSALLGGKPSGLCGFVPQGSDPRAECHAQDVITCGLSGGCSGAGACAKYADGTACGNGKCIGGKCGSAKCLDDVTAEDAAGAKHACMPFACRAGACLERCTSTSDCVAGFQCTTDGNCAAPPSDDSIPPGCVCALGAPAPKAGSGSAAIGLAALALVTARLRRTRRDRRERARTSEAT